MTTALPNRAMAAPEGPVGDFPRAGRLQAIRRDLETARDLRSALDALASALPGLVPVGDRVSLAMVEPGAGSLRVLRLLPRLESVPSEWPLVRAEGTVVGEVARDGLARVVSDLRAHSGVTFGRAAHDGIRSTLSVPVHDAQGRVLAVLNAGAAAPGACRASMLAELAELAEVVTLRLLELERASRAPEPVACGLAGRSHAFVTMLEEARRAAKCDEPLMVTGPTGAGKSSIARWIHATSLRRAGPIEQLHVAEIDPATLGDELFGAGPSGAPGVIERARGGTLVLDQVTELPSALQARLVRWLDEEARKPRGGDVRWVALSSRDPEQLAALGQFRSDLLQRLSVLTVRVPALRERPDDIEPIARAVLADIDPARARKLTSRAVLRLSRREWSGNVRELESLLRRAAALEPGEWLELDGIDAPRPIVRTESAEDWPTRDEQERRYLRRVLGHTAGVIEGPKGAARLLGMRASTLRSRLQKLGIALDHGRRLRGGSDA